MHHSLFSENLTVGIQLGLLAPAVRTATVKALGKSNYNLIIIVKIIILYAGGSFLKSG